MIAQRDLAWVSRLAPVAQLLEMMACPEKCEVRTAEVFQVLARDLWESYWYLSARMNDELVEPNPGRPDDAYFETLERMAGRFADKC